MSQSKATEIQFAGAALASGKQGDSHMSTTTTARAKKTPAKATPAKAAPKAEAKPAEKAAKVWLATATGRGGKTNVRKVSQEAKYGVDVSDPNAKGRGFEGWRDLQILRREGWFSSATNVTTFSHAGFEILKTSKLVARQQISETREFAKCVVSTPGPHDMSSPRMYRLTKSRPSSVTSYL
jgi:hypothetical protein